MQYNDGGYRRFPVPEYNKLIVPETDEIDEFATHDYEWADDQYSPAKQMEMVNLFNGNRARPRQDRN